jgi:hypothetical protein
VGSWPAAGLSGQISKNDCLYSVIQRRSDYFSFGTTTGKQIFITMNANFAGVFGVKENQADPTTGIVWGFKGFAAGAPQTLAIITPGSGYQLFISGQDSLTYGTYNVTRSDVDITPNCGGQLFIVPGTAAATQLSATNSCSATINRTTIPQSFGQPTYTHTFTAHLDGGKIYTISANTSFPATLTVYGPGGSFAAQSTNQVAGTKTVTVTPIALNYYTFEISSGSFNGPQIPANWSRGTGSYTLTVSP